MFSLYGEPPKRGNGLVHHEKSLSFKFDHAKPRKREKPKHLSNRDRATRSKHHPNQERNQEGEGTTAVKRERKHHEHARRKSMANDSGFARDRRVINEDVLRDELGVMKDSPKIQRGARTDRTNPQEKITVVPAPKSRTVYPQTPTDWRQKSDILNTSSQHRKSDVDKAQPESSKNLKNTMSRVESSRRRTGLLKTNSQRQENKNYPGTVARDILDAHKSRDKPRVNSESPRAVYNFVNGPGSALIDHWRILHKIGTGNYGEVFEGVHIHSGHRVAVKIAFNDGAKMLAIENELYKHLKQYRSAQFVPSCRYFGPYGVGAVLVMDLLGKSLYQLKEDRGGSLSIGTVLFIGVKLVRCLEALHSAGVLHRDIKPDNILTGTSDKKSLYLIDFGLASSFRSVVNGRHMSKPSYTTGFVGTARYASLNVHDGITPTRRDDLLSLGYTLLYLLRGRLPWQNVDERNPDREVQAIGREKKKYSFESLCDGIGESLKKYFQHVSELPFSHRPDYDYLVYILETGHGKLDLSKDIELE